MLEKIWDWFYNLSLFQWARSFIEGTTGLEWLLKFLIVWIPFCIIAFAIFILLYSLLIWLKELKNEPKYPTSYTTPKGTPTPEELKQQELRSRTSQSTPTTAPQSQSKPSTTTPAQQAPTPPPKAPSKPKKAPTPPQSQLRPSSPGTAQNTPTTAREPILVLAPYIVDYIITQFVDSDFCFDEVLGVPDEVRKDLTKYTAIGAWVDEKDPLMRYMEVCNNDITFYKILESPALLSFKITEREKYQKVHFSMIVAVNDEISTYMLNRPAPMHQLDDADYKRLEQSLLLRRQDIEDKYNLGNFQDYVERVKIAIPLKTSSEAPTPPQSQPRPSAQQAPVPPPKAPNKPSIEEELLNYLKAQPICWEFPLTTQDKALNKFCEALVFSDSVTGVGSNEAIKNLELTIQKKRARNPRLADHNAAMEGNILAILYEYSYLMHIFHALDDMKFDTTKVDIEKLWLLIQQDCNARINNLDEEKRKNPTIQIVLDKYKYDNQINRLKVLNDATGREMDYIIAFIMAYSLLAVISLLLGNPKLLQPLKPYSADDIAGMMNALINASAGLRFTGYSR